MSEDTYFPTLSAALGCFITKLATLGAVLQGDSDEVHMSFNGGVPYGHTLSKSFLLATLKGKATKKGAHITIYRMDSGTYELTSYVL